MHKSGHHVVKVTESSKSGDFHWCIVKADDAGLPHPPELASGDVHHSSYAAALEAGTKALWAMSAVATQNR